MERERGGKTTKSDYIVLDSRRAITFKVSSREEEGDRVVRSMKVPLFASLTDAELRLIAHSAYEETAAAGAGRAAVGPLARVLRHSRGHGRCTNSGGAPRPHRAGGLFRRARRPRLGASFGYPRLASVIATSPARLLVLPGARFNTLVRDVPGFGDQIRRAVRERLPGL